MFRSLAFALGAAVLTGLSLYGALRNGLAFSPDSWAYWQGSVSLLSGRGYSYADGHPIVFWPPGFPGYLAAWQALFGISVGTLVAAQIAVGSLAAFGWTALGLSIGNARGERVAACVVTALLTAATVSLYFRVLWANFALFALIPWLILATGRLSEARTQSDGILLAGLASLALLLMLLTHNSAIAFLPPLLAVALTMKRTARWPAVSLVMIAPAVWWTVRWWLGQLDDHAWTGGRYSPFSYLQQLWAGMAAPFGNVFLPGAIMLVLLLAVVPWKQLSRGQVVAFSTSVAACAGLVCVFSVVWIWDDLDERFTLFFALTVSALIGPAFLLNTGWLRSAAVVVVIGGWTAFAPFRLLGSFLETPPPGLVPVNATISAQAAAGGKLLLVKPPGLARNRAEMMQLEREVAERRQKR